MDDKSKSAITACLVLSLSAYCYILKLESKAYERALSQVDAGFSEFVQRSVNGKRIFTLINPNSVGVFKIKDTSIACAILSSPLPDRQKN